MSPFAGEPRYAVARVPMVIPSGLKPTGSSIRSGKGLAWAVLASGKVSAMLSTASETSRNKDRIIFDVSAASTAAYVCDGSGNGQPSTCVGTAARTVSSTRTSGVLCARRCQHCGHLVRSRDVGLCRDCRRRAAAARKSWCPRCGKPGFIRAETGWCGSCSRPGPAKAPPRICQGCGELRRHAGLGLCSSCWQCHPDRAFVRGATVAADLADQPTWLGDFVSYLAARHNPAGAAAMISALGRLLADEQSNHPQTLLTRASLPGRSIGPLARGLEGFFLNRGLALTTDHAEQRATLRRRRRIDAVPATLRPAVRGFEATMISNRERARRSGTRPRTDHTIETALATIRDFACLLNSHRGKHDW